MSTARLPEPALAVVPSRQRPGRKWHKVVFASAVAVVLLAILLGSKLWPFSQPSLIQNLRDSSGSEVSIGSFHRTYFPYPGCVIENLQLRHGSAETPLVTVRKLTVRGTYFGILRNHVSRLTAEGVVITIPPPDAQVPFHTKPSRTVIDEFLTQDAVLQFTAKDAHKPALHFEIRQAKLSEIGLFWAMRYEVKLHNPEPPGEITATGHFGPWEARDGSNTPVSGEYNFDHADLGHFGGIAGILSSRGKFSGTLMHINISGSTEVPDFMVRSGGHRVQLLTDFDAYVDATHGDTFLNRVDAHFGRTHVTVHGSIAGLSTRRGKVALFNLHSDRGRVEDILGLFTKEPRSPMAGDVALTANVEIPGGKEPFLDRVRLKGEFGIDRGRFSKPDTQTNVNKLSAGARGETKDDPEDVVTGLRGNVILQHGVANFAALSFGIPGATAKMHGTYGVIDHRVNLHGTMQVDTKISKTTTGMKAFLLKMIDPIFKKKKKGEVVPVHIGGTYEKPDFGLDIGKQAGTAPAPPQLKPEH